MYDDEQLELDLGDTTTTLDWRPELLIWKLWDEAHLPEYATEWSACFDLKASLRPLDLVKVYGRLNGSVTRPVDEDKKFSLYHGERVLIPTGLVFDLDRDTSLRIHPRSGLALKKGVIIANCEGVVDADYVQQTYVMLQNTSDQVFEVKDGDRIAQAEVVPLQQYIFEVSDREPENKTSRTGGLGSTGV